MVQVTVTPLGMTRVVPVRVAPVQVQVPAVYPASWASERVYSPALTVKDRLDPAAGLVSPPLEVVAAAGVPAVPVAVRTNWSLVACR